MASCRALSRCIARQFTCEALVGFGPKRYAPIGCIVASPSYIPQNHCDCIHSVRRVELPDTWGVGQRATRGGTPMRAWGWSLLAAVLPWTGPAVSPSLPIGRVSAPCAVALAVTLEAPVHWGTLEWRWFTREV